MQKRKTLFKGLFYNEIIFYLLKILFVFETTFRSKRYIFGIVFGTFGPGLHFSSINSEHYFFHGPQKQKTGSSGLLFKVFKMKNKWLLVFWGWKILYLTTVFPDFSSLEGGLGREGSTGTEGEVFETVIIDLLTLWNCTKFPFSAEYLEEFETGSMVSFSQELKPMIKANNGRNPIVLICWLEVFIVFLFCGLQ